ncbi:MAG: hypothetical protein LIO85_05675 [Rikenellaceae bacterium]|nr:hypothetical protein [Rikenellaceae bacterium]
MPQNKFALARYRVIDSLLRKNDYVKTLLMQEECIRRTGFAVTMRTIQLDIETMRNDDFLGYYSPIGYCRRRKAYYYTDASYSLVAFCFSEEEILLLEGLIATYRYEICPEDYTMLRAVVTKMKFLPE